jgi:hypothetical protein
MGDVIAWLGSNWSTILVTLLAVIGGASIIVKAIAPLTATDADDKAAAWLDKVHEWLSKIALNPTVKK